MELTLEFMSRNNISVSILSCAIPLPVFAVLPALHDVPACIDEIRFAMHTLDADGVALFTSYDSKHLGHPDFEIKRAELNSLSAVVFIHPTMEGMENSIREPFLIPRALIDWPNETTRTAIHLIMTDTMRTFPTCKIILSHGGGALSYIAGRTSEIPIQTKLSGKSSEEIFEDAKKFWFDTALMGDDDGPLELLLGFAQAGHVLYGSDYPFVREPAVVKRAITIDDIVDGDGKELPLVTRENALKLFPRLKARTKPFG
ncbi:hypothetical protein K458DRAFT_440022 [Lentithecium fluviatile CBS 122367]|uniref:6-methylsalicylate decarboxylase n=1 Tax=Lentithecium fluviatile CBS 122367 TaxID=1168545 RepID=A0A6G1JD08_9PLEO|nr:hypothetical protein K458DRAFT_440022 [Lentithecium fluviatile CBS 122367]